MKPTVLEGGDVYDFDELQRKYGLDNLDDLLQNWGISVFHRREDGPRLVWSDEWDRFIGGVIRRNGEMIEELQELRVKVDVPADAQFRSGWNRRRERLLERYPALRELVDGFVERVTDEIPNVRVKRNASTITVLLSESRTGIRLRKRGLRLVSTRDNEQREFWVESPGDFPLGISFITGDFSGKPVPKKLAQLARELSE
jgi:hypothetical protein